MTVEEKRCSFNFNMSEVIAVVMPTGKSTRQDSVSHIKRHKLANCNVPLVHGKPNPPINVRNRLTTHQRNHSLDFRYNIYIYELLKNIHSNDRKITCRRSMGILLPPVPQTSGTTLHHRNRSLDSALQRIPEVDVTPSPECETNPTPKVARPTIPTAATTTTTNSCKVVRRSSREREDLASLGSDDSGILCGSDSGSSDSTNNVTTTRESSVDHLHSRESLNSALSQAGDMDCVDINVDIDYENRPVGSLLTDNTSKETNVARELLSLTRDQVEVSSTMVDRELTGSAAMSLCCGATVQPDTESSMKKQPEIHRQETSQPKPSEGCLLRLFESQVFDMSMAVSYLFNSKEPGVQSYLGMYIFVIVEVKLLSVLILGNKLFSFPYQDVDFYLPQLVLMYITLPDVTDVLNPYLVHR